MHVLQKRNLATALFYQQARSTFLRQKEQVLLCYGRNGPVLVRGDVQETDEVTGQSGWQSAVLSTEQ